MAETCRDTVKQFVVTHKVVFMEIYRKTEAGFS